MKKNALLLKVICYGILWVNIPALVFIYIFYKINISLFSSIYPKLFIGMILGWLWWSINVGYWRKWALRKGIKPDILQKYGQMFGIVWAKGSIFSKTEKKVKDLD